jgi:hypothetical protein
VEHSTRHVAVRPANRQRNLSISCQSETSIFIEAVAVHAKLDWTEHPGSTVSTEFEANRSNKKLLLIIGEVSELL